MASTPRFLGRPQHWIGFLFLLPFFPLEAIYHSRVVVERVPRVGGSPTDSVYEYHLTSLTSVLGSSLAWVFWGGLIAFIIHAVYTRPLGRAWFWAKLLFLPVYFMAAFFWSLHVE
jgi:hypothetical protein